MGKTVLRDVTVEIDDVDLSDHIDNVVVNRAKEAVDANAFQIGKQRVHGLPDDSFELNFHQNFDEGSVNATLSALYEDEDEFDVLVKPKNETLDASNPGFFSDKAKLFEYQPLSGGIGALSETSVTIEVDGEIEELDTEPT